MGKGPDKFDCIAPPLATARGPFSGYGFFMEKRESPLWTSSSPGITGQFLGRPTLVSCPRNHAGICVVWLLRITLRQRRETRLGTVRAWILADWVPAVLPDLALWKMSLAILGASSPAPMIHNPIYDWDYSSMARTLRKFHHPGALEYCPDGSSAHLHGSIWPENFVCSSS